MDRKMVENYINSGQYIPLSSYTPDFKLAVGIRKAQKIIRDLEGGYLPIERRG